MYIDDLKVKFIKLYGASSEEIRVFTAPGRVNLIGEHTDYNGGFVFPAALSLGTAIVLRKNNENKVRMRVTDLPDFVEVDLNDLNKEEYRNLRWGNYQIGVMLALKEKGYDIIGCDMLYDDTLPHGGGLSSSAAIEVSTALAFATLSNEKNGKAEPVDMIEMAFCGQTSEREFCGVNCGIMDQFASAMGKKEHAIYLDCKKMEYDLVPLSLKGCKIVITNTNKKHSLASSKYNERRGECEKGFEILKKEIPSATCLGDISADEFEAHKNAISDETVLKRVTHVIYEDDRVLKSVEALKRGDLETFGKLMNESHDSLSKLYEVTGAELDTLAYEAQKLPGVLGSRMTGAGFGGCTVSIVKENFVDEFIETLDRIYTSKISYPPSFIVDETGDGGREIK